MSNKPPVTENTEEIDLIELIKTIWEKRKFIIKLTIIGAVAGLVVAFSIPREYTTSVTMAPEGMKTSSAGGMANLAALAGVDLGGKSGSDGINLMLYPNIVQSTPFIIEMSQIKVKGKEMEAPISLYDYIDKEIKAPWWSSVLSVPMTVVGWVMSIGKEKEESLSTLNPYELTVEQAGILTSLRSRIGIDVDKKTGIITASSTMQDPRVVATVSDTLVNKLEQYVLTYRIEKAKRDLDFTENLFQEAKQKYYDAQRRYAQYADAYQNTVRQSARVELERLQNEQQLAFSVYNQMAQQLEAAKIKVQEQTPCVTIIEPASVPVRKSNTSKLMILIAFIFLGGFAGVGTVVVKDLFLKKEEQPSDEVM